jgi:hypothetical protein
MTERVASLEIEADPAFQAAEWRATRIAWVCFAFLIAAAVLGLFGSGPLSTARAGTLDGRLQVDYGRFGRFGAPMRLVVHARPDQDGAVEITLNRELVDTFVTQSITPTPERAELTGDGVRYRFAAAGIEDSIPVVFDVQASRRGRIHAAIRSPSAEVRFTQFIYP